MPTLFTRIIEGDIPGTFIWRDESCVGFMTIEPLRPGHALIVPISEVDHWLDLPDQLRDHLFGVAAKVGRAINDAFNPQRVGLMIAGLEVPHAHLHVVPIEGVHDLDFANADRNAAPDEIESAASKIREALRAAGVDGGVSA